MNYELLMQRQHLLKPATADEFDDLFRNMSPVHTQFWTNPGAPPDLSGRCDFDDLGYCFQIRATREIVKGRFQGQSVGYVFSDELDLMAAAFRKTGELSYDEQKIFDIVHQEGPINIQTIKELTGILSKNIAPILHKLQQKFLVFEDQSDNEWDRCWYVFEQEFDINLNRYEHIEAVKILLMRFAFMNVIFDEAMARNFYGFTLKDIKQAVSELLESGALVAVEGGYARAEDAAEAVKDKPAEKSLILLNKNDFLVKSNEHWLKKKYTNEGNDVLYYILIDGAFHGAVFGHFRFMPHIVDDVFIDLSSGEVKALKKPLMDAVEKIFDKSVSPLLHYMGKEI